MLPNLAPAMFAGVALAFARAIGEFGSLILISGNIPFDTEVASVFIFKQVEAGNEAAAASVSVGAAGRSRSASSSSSTGSVAGGRAP